MSKDEIISFSLEADTSKVATNIAELNRLLTTYLSLAHRVGLPEDIMDAMRRIQQLRIIAQTATTAINLLYTATGPIGWAIGLGGLAVSGFMWADWIEAETRGR